MPEQKSKYHDILVAGDHYKKVKEHINIDISDTIRDKCFTQEFIDQPNYSDDMVELVSRVVENSINKELISRFAIKVNSDRDVIKIEFEAPFKGSSEFKSIFLTRDSTYIRLSGLKHLPEDIKTKRKNHEILEKEFK
ncbi:hypothetical protein ASswx1_283 [Aeromonas phage Asswx_1]|uniref:Uncharacterized protein n=1 Tax=Aeromonas phage Asswx_1 TaxID=2419739 RepID=A0A411B8G8_9CAUD|nr:hypothetical protein ASswx1_283 [Aeromonas phage Asswx_1]